MDTINQADPTQVAAGQMYPEDFANDYAVTAFLIRQALAEMETCTPVQVKAVHAGSGSPPAGGTVDVQLLLSTLDGNGNATKPGVVYGLPFMRMQSGQWAIIADPVAGDFGFIISSSRDISNIVKTPGKANPGSFRHHSFSDGFFLPCSFSGAAPAGTMWLKSDGSLQVNTKDNVVIKSDGSGNLTVQALSATINATSGALALQGQGGLTLQSGTGTVNNAGGSSNLNWTGNIAVTGNITATGEITAKTGPSSVGLSTHKHSALNTSPTPGT